MMVKFNREIRVIQINFKMGRQNSQYSNLENSSKNSSFPAINVSCVYSNGYEIRMRDAVARWTPRLRLHKYTCGYANVGEKDIRIISARAR